jgi:hypothetical protein
MVAMSGLVLLTFLRMDERCQQASARKEELAKKVQGAVSLLTTAKWRAIPDGRCYNRLRLPGVPIRHIARTAHCVRDGT